MTEFESSSSSFASDSEVNCPYRVRLERLVQGMSAVPHKPAVHKLLYPRISHREAMSFMKGVLYRKHAYSLDMHYASNIEAYLNNRRSVPVIRAQYKVAVAEKVSKCDQAEDDLVSTYLDFEHAFDKLMQLVEYYKFHVEVPRMFAHFVGPKVLRYHQKKRNIYYHKICTRLQDETSTLTADLDIKQRSIEKELDQVFFNNRFKAVKMDVVDDRLESQSIRQLRDKLSELLRVEHPQLSTLRVEYPKRTSAVNRNRVDDLMAKLNIRIGGQSKINQEDRTLKMKQETIPGLAKNQPDSVFLTRSIEIKPESSKSRPSINIAFAKSFDSKRLEKSVSPNSKQIQPSKLRKASKARQLSTSKDKHQSKKTSDRKKRPDNPLDQNKPKLCYTLQRHLKGLPDKRRQLSNPYDLAASLAMLQNTQQRLSHQGKATKKLTQSPDAFHHQKTAISSVLKSRKSCDSVRVLFQNQMGSSKAKGSFNDPSTLQFTRTFRPTDDYTKGAWKKELFLKNKKSTRGKTKSSHNLLAASVSNLELSSKGRQKSNLQVKLDILDYKLGGKIQDCFHVRRDTLPVDIRLGDGMSLLCSPGKHSKRAKKMNDLIRRSNDQLPRQQVFSTRQKLSERGLGGFMKLTKSQHLKTHHAKLGSLLPEAAELQFELPRDSVAVKFSPKFSSRHSKF